MTEAERIKLENYVRDCADLMGLRDWRFDIRFGEGVLSSPLLKESDDGEFVMDASSLPVPGQKRSVIEFSETIRDKSEEEVAEIVCHELLHCHMADVYECGRTGLREHLGQQAYDVFMHGFSTAWEHAVDSIAYPWSQMMPGISWHKEKEKK